MKTRPTAPERYSQVLKNSFTEWYASGRDVWSRDPTMRDFANFVHANIVGPNSKSLSILDIGAGRGYDAASFASKGHNIVGLDIVEFSEWAQIREEYPDKVDFVVADFNTWQRPSRRFDAVVDNGCLHHQHRSAISDYLMRVSNCLVPGGHFAVNLFHVNESAGDVWQMPDGRLTHFYCLETATNLLQSSGFQLVAHARVDRRMSTFKHDLLYILSRRS